MRWLVKLGYHLQGANTFGAYTDKHDDKAVTDDRDNVYIPTMRKVLKECEVWITVKDKEGKAVCVLADEYQLESGECIPQDQRHVHTDFKDAAMPNTQRSATGGRKGMSTVRRGPRSV